MPRIGRVKPAKAKAKPWRVEVVAFANNEVVETIECESERSAERVERGVLINMNREDYFTRIEGPKQ